MPDVYPDDVAALRWCRWTVRIMDNDDLYERLGVAPSAPVEVIAAAYKALMKQHHPDLAADEPDRLRREQRCRLMGEAHGVLTDPSSRDRYDTQRRQATVSQPDHEERVDGAAFERAHTGEQSSTATWATEQGAEDPFGWTSPAGEVVTEYDALGFSARRRLGMLAFADRDWRRFRRALLRHRRRIGGLPMDWFGGAVDAPATAASWRATILTAASLLATTTVSAWLWSLDLLTGFARSLVGPLWIVPIIHLPAIPVAVMAFIAATTSVWWMRRYGGWLGATRRTRIRAISNGVMVGAVALLAPLLVMPALAGSLLAGAVLWVSQRSA